jgi:cytochrome c553
MKASAIVVLLASGALTSVAAAAGTVADCVGCHRARAPGSGEVPIIVGQRADYLAQQLEQFAQRHRDSFPMREIARSLDARTLAAELAAMPWPERRRREQPRAERVRAANLVRGAGCAACHERDFGGRDFTPRLAGQEPGYLARTLEQFASGERIHLVQDPIRAWSRDDRGAVAAWLARRPGPRPVD